MKRSLITMITITILLAFSLTACRGKGIAGPEASPDNVPEILGSFSVNGIDPLGADYGGNLTVTAGDSADTYELQWIVTGSIQKGHGRLEGNTLYVEWETISSTAVGQSHGTATYKVTVNGELVGTRLVEGHPGEGTETAFPN